MKPFIEFVKEELDKLESPDREVLLKAAMDIDTLEDELEIEISKDKSALPLGLIVKVGTPGRSGNYGHTSLRRRGQKGGSDPAKGGKKQRSKQASEGKKKLNRLKDIEWAKKHKFVPTKRNKEGALVLANGKPLPEHVRSGLHPADHAPPAWDDVYVNPDPNSINNPSMVLRGRDVAGGVVGLYGKSKAGDRSKDDFKKIYRLEKEEPAITKKILKDWNTGKGETRDNAAVLRLIQVSAVRPGSEKETGSLTKTYGATILEGRHVFKESGGVRLDFVGKEAVRNIIHVTDKALVADLMARKNKAGNTGKIYPNTGYNSLLKYTKSLGKEDYTPKNFRKLRATQWAIGKMEDMKPPKTEKEYKTRLKEVGSYVGTLLGHHSAKGDNFKEALNTYIDPHVFADWKQKGWGEKKAKIPKLKRRLGK